MAKSIVRVDGEGDRTWFYGGGVHTWKATSEETAGALFAFEDTLERGKCTPLHMHPDADEVVFVIEGEIRTLIDGEERTIGRGAMTFVPRGVGHAFEVVSERARLLNIQTPGKGDAFYRAASEPAASSAGPVDFARVASAAKRTGAMVVLGPPPFAGGR